MDTEKYINKVTLEFLLNPLLQEKLAKSEHNDATLIPDIKFYRKRICQLSKDMCKGIYINDSLKPAFLNYTTALIYYLKQLDEKDILQSEYDDLVDNSVSIETDISMDICNNDFDKLLINIPKPVNNLDNFIKKINVNVQDKILPQKKITNTKDPILKTKGLKKKNLK
jgi:hypothetical protein